MGLFLAASAILTGLARGQGKLEGGSETVEMLYRNWTTRDGLPQDHVRVMLGTRDGFLWLGTDEGLARFDGVHFKTYGLHEGLGAITVLSLYEAQDGALWVGTLGGGVSVIRNGGIQRTYGSEDGLISVGTIAEDAGHHIWVASLAGLARLEGEHFVPMKGPDGTGNPPVRSLHFDRTGILWATLSSQLWQWVGEKWKKPEAGAPTSAANFCEDGQGRLWIADAENRIWTRESGKWRSLFLPPMFPSSVNSLSVAPDGTLWIGFYRSGICAIRHDQLILPTTAPEHFSDIAENVFVSPDGQLWLGTSTRGLYSLTPRRISVARVDDKNDSPGVNFIGALAETSPGEFLVGTQGRGYFVWKEGSATVALGQSPFVNGILRTRDGRILGGGTHGIHEYRNGTLTHLNVSPTLVDVWEIREDRDGGLWVGQGNGRLYHVDGTVAHPIDYGGKGDPIKGLVQEPDGTLWIGTRGNGLFRLRGTEAKRFGKADGLPTEVIRVLYLGHDGTLWVGTAGGGLAVRTGDTFHPMTSREGLPDDVVSQITEDDTGRLWLGTNRGLAVFSPEETVKMRAATGDELHPLLLNRADGLRSQEFTITPPVRTSNGEFAFATIDGFATLTPGDFQADPRTPPVIIEQVLANGQPVEVVDGKLTLPPGIERLEIQFTGLHFGAPERLRFRNRLAGLETDWGMASPERRVEYRNLRPGQYRFEISGTIGNGLWSPQPAVVEIVLKPHFWETTWFRIVVIAGTLGLVVVAVRRRERMRARRKIEALKREQAVHTERARIARDLHDDVGASLTQVALLSELAQGDLTTRPDRASNHINEIFTTAQDVTRALDEIVWAVNPAHDTLESFATFLGAFVQNYARSADLTARLDLPATLPATALSSAIRHHLYLATKEVLHNVVKHAQATEIRLTLSIEGPNFHITLQDNGRGLDRTSEPAAPGADGLPNLQERLQQIGGTCTYHSRPGEGTRVEMVVPLARE